WRARWSSSIRRFFSSASRAAALSRSCSILLSSAGLTIPAGLVCGADFASLGLAIRLSPLLFRLRVPAVLRLDPKQTRRERPPALHAVRTKPRPPALVYARPCPPALARQRPGEARRALAAAH